MSSSESMTTIAIKKEVKRKLDTIFYNIKIQTENKFDWSTFIDKTYENAEIVGGTVLKCKPATF